METTALTDNKLVMYTSEQVQQMLNMVVRSLSRQGLNNAPRPSHKKAKRSRRFSGRIRAASILAFSERFLPEAAR